MGQKLTKPAQAGGRLLCRNRWRIDLFLASALGRRYPPTHTITGAIVGVGSACRRASVRWGLAASTIVGLG